MSGDEILYNSALSPLQHIVLTPLQCGCRPKPLHSTFNYKADLLRRPLTKVLLTDFFGDRKRVASRRHKSAQSQPQCTTGSGQVAAENSSSPEWKTSTHIPTFRQQAYSSLEFGISQHMQLYADGHCWMTADLALLVILAAVALAACSLFGRHQQARIKQLQLVCWPG